MKTNIMKTFLAAPGIKFDFIDPDNSTVRETVPGNSYEPAVAHLLKTYVKPGDTVLDIGALYGYFGCFCGSISPTVTVFAFDPCPDYCAVIKKNAQINQLNNLHAVPLALSDTNSQWNFKEKTLIAGTRGKATSSPAKAASAVNHDTTGTRVQHDRVSFVGWFTATLVYLWQKLFSPPQSMTINSIRYDDWAKQNNIKANLAKIDVHGAEVVVLRGMREALVHDLEHLILEVHRIDMLVDGDYSEIVEMLEQSGFTLHELVDFRNDKRWHIKKMSADDIRDFINPQTWSIKNKVEMRMIFATKGELHAS
jgi:FkbM family methyltransferase